MWAGPCGPVITRASQLLEGRLDNRPSSDLRHRKGCGVSFNVTRPTARSSLGPLYASRCGELVNLKARYMYKLMREGSNGIATTVLWGFKRCYSLTATTTLFQSSIRHLMSIILGIVPDRVLVFVFVYT